MLSHSTEPPVCTRTAGLSRVDRDETARTYRYLCRELNLEVKPADPGSYVPRFVSELNLSGILERCARAMLTAARRQRSLSGKSPVGLVAGIYAASLETGGPVTQRAIADVADVTEVTDRNRYGELVELAPSDTASVTNTVCVDRPFPDTRESRQICSDQLTTAIRDHTVPLDSLPTPRVRGRPLTLRPPDPSASTSTGCASPAADPLQRDVVHPDRTVTTSAVS